MSANTFGGRLRARASLCTALPGASWTVPAIGEVRFKVSPCGRRAPARALHWGEADVARALHWGEADVARALHWGEADVARALHWGEADVARGASPQRRFEAPFEGLW